MAIYFRSFTTTQQQFLLQVKYMKVVLFGLFILLRSLLKVFSNQGQFRIVSDLPLYTINPTHVKI